MHIHRFICTKWLHLSVHAWVVGILALVAVSATSVAAAQEEIRLVHPVPWSAGAETLTAAIGRLKESSIRLTLEGTGRNQVMERSRHPMAHTPPSETELLVLARNQWFELIQEEVDLLVIATAGPEVIALSPTIKSRTLKDIDIFLNQWQAVWVAAKWPYGVQPASKEQLRSSYLQYVEKRRLKALGAEKIHVPDIRLKWIPIEEPDGAKIRRLTAEFYASFGIQLVSMNSSPGTIYEGRILNRAPREPPAGEYLWLDVDPCHDQMVNVTHHYDRQFLRMMECDGQQHEIFRITTRP